MISLVLFFFVYSQLNLKAVLFQTIQFSISTMLKNSSNSNNSVKKKYSFHIKTKFYFKHLSLAYKNGSITNIYTYVYIHIHIYTCDNTPSAPVLITLKQFCLGR